MFLGGKISISKMVHVNDLYFHSEPGCLEKKIDDSLKVEHSGANCGFVSIINQQNTSIFVKSMDEAHWHRIQVINFASGNAILDML